MGIGDIVWVLKPKKDGTCSEPMPIKIIGWAQRLTEDGYVTTVGEVKFMFGNKTYLYPKHDMFCNKEDAIKAKARGYIPTKLEKGGYYV